MNGEVTRRAAALGLAAKTQLAKVKCLAACACQLLVAHPHGRSNRGAAVNLDAPTRLDVIASLRFMHEGIVQTTLIGILAAVVPARRAAQLDPAVAIRG